MAIGNPQRVGDYCLDYAVIVVGGAALLDWINILVGGTFSLFCWALVPLALGSLWFARSPVGEKGEAAAVFTGVSSRWLIAATVSIAAAAFIPGLIYFVAAVVAALTFYGLAWRSARVEHRAPSPYTASRYELILLAGIILLAVGFTLISSRSDADDEAYVETIFKILNNPDSAIAGLRDLDWDSGYVVLAYPMLEAAVAKLSGLPALAVYYLIFPAGAAGLAVLAYYRLFRALLVKDAALATLIAIVVLASWADIHRSPGNFAFVRLFQGKAVFCTVLMPLVFALALEGNGRRWRNILLLALATAAAISTTQTAIVLMPVFLSIVFASLLVGWMTTTREWTVKSLASRLFKISAIPLAVPLLAGCLILSRPRWHVLMPQHFGTPAALTEGFSLVFSPGLHTAVGMAALILLPFLVSRGPQTRLATLTFGLMALTFNPLTDIAFQYLNGSLNWRVLWLLPVVPASALLLMKLADLVSVRHRGWSFGALAIFCVAYAFAGQSSWESRDANLVGWPNYKIPNQHAIHLRQANADFPIVNGRVCFTNPTPHCL